VTAMASKVPSPKTKFPPMETHVKTSILLYVYDFSL